MQRIRPFGYHEPSTLREAAELLLAYRENARILAGGTDLLVLMRRLKVANAVLINIKRIPGLEGVTRHDDGRVEIGALTTVNILESLPHPGCAVLRAASRVLGTRSVRNRATIGGNVGRASPASDLSSPLITLNAEACVYGPLGERLVPMSRLFLGPGRPDLGVGELITGFRIPAQPEARGWYLKAGRTCGSDCAQAGVAVQLHLDGYHIREARVSLTAVGPTPLPAPQTEAVLRGALAGPEVFAQAALVAADEARPLTDFRASADYRRVLIKTLTVAALTTAYTGECTCSHQA